MPDQEHADAITLLKADHRKVEELLAQEKGAGLPPAKHRTLNLQPA